MTSDCPLVFYFNDCLLERQRVYTTDYTLYCLNGIGPTGQDGAHIVVISFFSSVLNQVITFDIHCTLANTRRVGCPAGSGLFMSLFFYEKVCFQHLYLHHGTEMDKSW